jgi:hypothetical protein
LTQNVQVDRHVPNLICIKDVFGPLEKTFKGYDCMLQFINFMAWYNRGKCILVAHNSGRYDSRLLFDTLMEFRVNNRVGNVNEIGLPKTIMRGNNFLKIEVDNLLFIDSLNHLPGSLRNLGRDYGADSHLVKGYFPYTFNTEENWDYEGRIPGREWFEISHGESELQEFNQWYIEAFSQPWNLQTELEKYCKQDVLVLANIVRKYHEICCQDNNGLSPWFFVTAPSYVHQCYLRHITMQMELPDPKQDYEEYTRVCEEKAKDYWVVLTSNEYHFAREALRGGRTDVRQFYAKLDQSEIEQGVRFAYVDVVSLYPYQQAVHDFPVGKPEIHIWDRDYKPCNIHLGTLKCGCTLKNIPRQTKVIYHNEQLSEQEILDDQSFFGIVCASVEPPKDLFHPVLPVYDEESLKCTFPLDFISQGIFTSIEFKRALQVGYRLVEIHRFDKYKAKPSLWADKVKQQYFKKMINSRNRPSEEENQRLIQEYENKFEMGDDLQRAYDQDLWGKRGAMKQAYKTMVNCAWGKHAEKINRDTTIITNIEGNNDFDTVVYNHSAGLNNIRIVPLNDECDLIRVRNDYTIVEPNLYNAYLPCAVFVPAYGRLQLWEELHKLGKRVLYHDTDSIIYKTSVTGEYNIPENDIWGEWEREDEDVKNGGIVEFVSSGPKSYGFKCLNGYTKIKFKGVSLTPKTSRLINFDILKELVVQGIAENEPQLVGIPQRQFNYRIGHGIYTLNMIKKIGFSPEHVKGFIGNDLRHYPIGYAGLIT